EDRLDAVDERGLLEAANLAGFLLEERGLGLEARALRGQVLADARDLGLALAPHDVLVAVRLAHGLERSAGLLDEALEGRARLRQQVVRGAQRERDADGLALPIDRVLARVLVQRRS